VTAAAVTRFAVHPVACARSLLLCVLLLFALRAAAHPIVSTDINRHVSIHVADARLEIRYVYEMLEIAAINTARAWDADSDGSASERERDAFADAWSAELQRALLVALDAEAVPLTLRSRRWELDEGAFGLATWKLTAVLEATLPVRSARAAFTYDDRLRPEEVGWKEIVLTAGGATGIASSSVPAQDRSYQLTDYDAMLALPNPDQTSVRAVLRFGGFASEAEAEEAPPSSPPSARPAPTARPIAPTEARPAAPLRQENDSAVPATSPVGSPETTSTAIPQAPAAVAQSPAGQGSAVRYYAWPFFKLGAHHIATGVDHLLFLLGLMLFRQSVRRLIAVVTAFTLAHSVTLALAAAGLVHPPAAGVEFLIAASIAYVGFVAWRRPDSRHGPLLALGFGLVHGLGFAGALGDALAGVAGRGWLVALGSFNLGIEAFQLLLVVLVWPLLRAMERRKAGEIGRLTLCALVLLAGLAWMLARAGALTA